MSNPLFDLYVKAGSPLGKMDIDNVSQWAFSHINYLEHKMHEIRYQYDYAVTEHFQEIERLRKSMGAS